MHRLPPVHSHRSSRLSPNQNRDWDTSPRRSSTKDAQARYDALHDPHLKFATEDVMKRLSFVRPSQSVHDENQQPKHLAPIEIGNPTTGVGPRAHEAFERLRAQREHYVKLLHQRSHPAHGLSVESAIAPKSRSMEEEQVRPDDVFIRARERLRLLWDELSVDGAMKEHFEGSVFLEVSAENISLMHHEVERLVRVRTLEKDLKAHIDARESFLYLLMDLAEKVTSSLQRPPRAESAPLVERRKQRTQVLVEEHPFSHLEGEWGQTLERQLSHYLGNIRRSTFEVLSTMQLWRQALGYDAVFLWRGTSYLIKIMTDLDFLSAYPELTNKVRYAIVGNPLLDPKHRKGAVERAMQRSELHGRTDDEAEQQRAQLDNEAALASYSRPATRSQSSRLPSRQSGGSADSQNRKITREMFLQADEMLYAEASIWKTFVASASQRRFEASFIEADEELLRAARRECMFNDEAQQQAEVGRVRRSEHNERLRLIAHVLTIQRAFRGYRVRCQNERKTIERAAAVTIQAIVRRSLAKNVVKQQRMRRDAATKIQALQRGRATRDHLKSVTHVNYHTTAVCIQRAWRRYSAIEQLHKRRYLHVVVRRVQALVRGYLTRKQGLPKNKRMEVAATKIQAVWKGSKSRQVDPRLSRAAVKIQRWIRKVIAIRFVARLREVSRAASKIQAFFQNNCQRRLA